ncbi:MAG TPA: hypothetical protein VGK94_06395 [Candidatus Polarisedimenticolia bacterium]|jgi:hypothetical protein
MVRRTLARVALATMAVAAVSGAPWAALGRPIVFLDGDPSIRATNSEDLLFTQRVPGRKTTEFGSAAAFGDVNGDGLADAVIGQRTENKVFIYLGAAAPLAEPYAADPNAADFVIWAPTGTSDKVRQFGFSVAASDLDGDGHAEIIIGAPFSDPGGHSDRGLAWVIFGLGNLVPPRSFTLATAPAGLSILKLTRGAASKNGDLLGFAVGAGALDPNNAAAGGYLAVTARNADGPAGADTGVVHVALGSALAAADPNLGFDLDVDSSATIFGSDASDAFGEAVATCDFDGSGVADLVVGAIYGDGRFDLNLNRGEALLFLGQKLASGQLSMGVPADTAADLAVYGARDGDDLGFSVACGDLDVDPNDRKADLILGAPFADSITDPITRQGRPTAGEVYVVRGRSPLSGAFIDLSVAGSDPNDPAPLGADLALFGATTADQLGYSVGVGDLNGDGFGDLIAGARRYDRDQNLSNVGAAYLLLGSVGFLNPSASGKTRGIDLHRGTSRTVDLNHDPNDTIDHLPERVDGIVIGASRDDHAGWSVAAGDIDGDRSAELLISAIGDLAHTPGFRGEAYVVTLGDSDADGYGDLADLDDDNDGVPDDVEDADGDGAIGGDTDLDRVLDPNEIWTETDPRNHDSDGDLIQDGTELGYTCAGDGGVVEVACDDPNVPFTGTDPNSLYFVPDADPATTSDPLDVDSDEDGLPDRIEDADHDGALDPAETDPDDPDTDGDGLFDGTERGVTLPAPPGTDPNSPYFVPDADAGVTLTDPALADTDGDLIDDGTEDSNRDGAIGGDADLDHVVDSNEIWTETDPTDSDSDRDGLSDGIEDRDRNGMRDGGETNPLDQDSDDDGISDGGEDRDLDGNYGPGDGESSPLSVDSDGDGIKDSVEAGLASTAGLLGRNGVADSGPNEDGTYSTAATIQADGDAGATVTRPWDADTDDDGLPDGFIDGFNPNAGGAPGGVADTIASIYEGEDLDRDGVLDPGETDPLTRDTDVDGVKDGEERGVTAPGVLGPDGLADPVSGGVQDGTSGASVDYDADETTLTEALDGDTDDDALSDGTEDANDDGAVGPGESNPNDGDSDDDLLPDGLERGRTTGVTLGMGNDTDPNSPFFIPDLDPNTMTDPIKTDTDGGGATDGAEDADRNGRVDAGERNPNDRRDDDPSAVLEFTEGLNGIPKTTPIAPSETIFLRLDDDTDANLDPNVAETVTVQCASDVPSNAETVTLTAVAVDTGVFAGSLPTNTTDPNIPGELTVASGATVTCTYADPTATPPATIAASLTAPGPIPEFDVEMSTTGRVAWAPAGGTSLQPTTMTWNLYRGDLMILRATGLYTQTAMCGLTDPFADDATALAPGAGALYLAAGVAGGVQGSLGQDSSGRPRPSTQLCTP